MYVCLDSDDGRRRKEMGGNQEVTSSYLRITYVCLRMDMQSVYCVNS